MPRFIEGQDWQQVTLMPECLDDFITDDNPVRVIDAFVGELDLTKLGFEGAEPAATGRPSYHPADLLKVYIYGYLNRVQSGRRLERECQRHIELMWRAIADRGYYSAMQIKACADSGIAPILPKPTTSGAKADGRFEKSDFIYIARNDEYECPAGERATYRFTGEQQGQHRRSRVGSTKLSSKLRNVAWITCKTQ